MTPSFNLSVKISRCNRNRYYCRCRNCYSRSRSKTPQQSCKTRRRLKTRFGCRRNCSRRNCSCYCHRKSCLKRIVRHNIRRSSRNRCLPSGLQRRYSRNRSLCSRYYSHSRKNAQKVNLKARDIRRYSYYTFVHLSFFRKLSKGFPPCLYCII